MSAAPVGQQGRLTRISMLVAGTALVSAVSLASGGGMAQAAPGGGHGATGPGSHAAGAGSRAAVAAGTISTVAGGVGGPGLATQVDVQACGVAYGAGAVYAAAGQTVRRVSPGTDWLTTVAGTDSFSPLGDGGPATSANVLSCGTTVDPHGSLLIADGIDLRIRVVAKASGTFYGQAMTAGHIYTVAGDGRQGDTGDGGPATAAALTFSDGISTDRAGNLVLPEEETIRVVAAASGTFYGQRMTAGDIYTVAGNGTLGFAGDGGPAGNAEFFFPYAVAVDGNGNLVIADSGNQRVRVLAAVSGTFYGEAMTKGDVYTVAGGGTAGLGDGGPATSAELDDPLAVALDRTGNLVIADAETNRVRVVAIRTGVFYGQAMQAGHIYTVAGNGRADDAGYGGPATGAELQSASGVAFDGNGNLLIAASGRVLAVAVKDGTFYRQAMTAGDIYVVASNGAPSQQGGTQGYSGDRGPATRAELDFPGSVTVDSAGNMVIADSGNFRVRVVAARSGTFYGQKMTTNAIYTIAGDGQSTFSGNGGPATKTAISPGDVVRDAAGNLVIADARNERVYVVAVSSGTFYGQAMTAGHIYLVAGSGRRGAGGDGGPATRAGFHSPTGVAVDSAGNLVIADSNNGRIRVVAVKAGTFYGQKMTAGDIYTVAQTSDPEAVTVDRSGNVVLSEDNNSTVQVLAVTSGTFYGQQMTAGHLYIVAGGGSAGVGDGGPATDASLQFPEGVAIDGAGNLLIADTDESRVRIVPVTSGTFYGQHMTAEHIYTLAGDGNQGYFGDGGPATSAWIALPAGMTVDSAGNLLIADYDTGRIREVTR